MKIEHLLGIIAAILCVLAIGLDRQADDGCFVPPGRETIVDVCETTP